MEAETVIRIAITDEAYEAICADAGARNRGLRAAANENGERGSGLRNVGSTSSIPSGAPARATRRPSSGWPRCGKDVGHTSDAEQAPPTGESYSDVILRLAGIEASRLGRRE